MMNNLYNTIQEIVYGEIAFVSVIFLAIIVFFLLNVRIKKTMMTELILTFIPIIAIFGIPYLAITCSLTITLIIVCTLATFLSIGLFLPFKERCMICGNVAIRTLVNHRTKELKPLCNKHLHLDRF